jgi:hypothetical protein
MLSRSALFDQAVIDPASIGAIPICQANITDGVQAIRTLLEDVPVVGGSVRVDGSAAIRRTLQCQIIDEVRGDLTPRFGGDTLAPFGHDIQIKLGFAYADGSSELLPIFQGRIDDAETNEQGLISIQASDWASVIQATKFEKPYPVQAGVPIGQAIQLLLQSRMAGLTYNFEETGDLANLTVYQEGDASGDPWANAQQLAQVAGKELFFGSDGTVILRAVPDPLVGEPWPFAPGEKSVLLGARNKLSARAAHNVAIVIGEGTGLATPIRSQAEVTDPTSPIFPGGPFGRRPIFFRDSNITNVTQAYQLASNYIRNESLKANLISFDIIPHPALEAGDVVQVTVPDLVDARVVLDNFSIDLGLKIATNCVARAIQIA